MTALADQVEVARLAVGVFEAESPLAEIHLSGDTRVDHPLQRAIDRRATDSMIFVPEEINEVVGAEVAFLTQEDVDDLCALARAFAAVWLQPAEIRKSAVHHGTRQRYRCGADDSPL